jgi:hypothetical protein
MTERWPMNIKEELSTLYEKLKTERDSIKLKLHLASMDAREEFEGAEKKWHQISSKMNEIADEAVDTSEAYLLKAKEKSEELKELYNDLIKKLHK